MFPASVAPFKLIIVPINYHKSLRVRNLANTLYQQCLAASIEVLLEDRKERPGILFKDSELIGLPHRVVVSDTHADHGTVEYTERRTGEKIDIKSDDVISFIQSR